MRISMNYSGTFHGAVSDQLYRFKAGKPFELKDAEDAKHLAESDYKVVSGKAAVEESKDDVAPKGSGAVNIAKLKKDELIALAKDRGVALPEGATKDQIIALLQTK